MKVKIFSYLDAQTKTGFGIQCPKCSSIEVEIKFSGELSVGGTYYICVNGHAFALATPLRGDDLSDKVGSEIEI